MACRWCGAGECEPGAQRRRVRGAAQAGVHRILGAGPHPVRCQHASSRLSDMAPHAAPACWVPCVLGGRRTLSAELFRTSSRHTLKHQWKPALAAASLHSPGCRRCLVTSCCAPRWCIWSAGPAPQPAAAQPAPPTPAGGATPPAAAPQQGAGSAAGWPGPDESAPVTSIQLRLADGSRLVARFNLTQVRTGDAPLCCLRPFGIALGRSATASEGACHCVGCHKPYLQPAERLAA
jgi:UBX domain